MTAEGEHTSFKYQASLISEMSAIISPSTIKATIAQYNPVNTDLSSDYIYIVDKIRKIAASGLAGSTGIPGDSGPGFPYNSVYTETAEVLAHYFEEICAIATSRVLKLLTTSVEDMSPLELLKEDYCDVVSFFIKNEPHPLRKTIVGRYRLISHVPVVDQIVQRFFLGDLNKQEIMQWKTIPSQPGISFKDDDLSYVRDKIYSFSDPCEADISGWDWSLRYDMLMLESDIRYALTRDLLGNALPAEFKQAFRNLFHIASNSVFRFSDGKLVTCPNIGIMKSGAYYTSSTNSHLRVLAATHVGSTRTIAMGDDSVEEYVENAVEKYKALGMDCKMYNRVGNIAEFCSREYPKEGNLFKMVSWPKTVSKFFYSNPIDLSDLQMRFNQLKREMRYNILDDFSFEQFLNNIYQIKVGKLVVPCPQNL